MQLSLLSRSGTFLLLILLYSTTDCTAAESFTDVEYVKNHDGDSITFNIPGTPAIMGKNMVIRLRGVDTPELGGKNCPAEEEKARSARQLVHRLLKDARRINLLHIERGKYFRILADVEFDGRDLGTLLLDKGLAVGYSGGKKTHDWCASGNDAVSIKPQSHSRPALPPKISGVYVWPPPPVQDSNNDKKQ